MLLSDRSRLVLSVYIFCLDQTNSTETVDSILNSLIHRCMDFIIAVISI